MRVVAYPADQFGCGYLRIIAPCRALQAMGHDVEIVTTQNRRVQLHVRGGVVEDVDADADVVVLQRTTSPFMAQAVSVLRSKGVAVIVDVDDDLTSVHPSNPARAGLYQSNPRGHSWKNLNQACRDATLVTLSTPALLSVYGAHGRGRVLPNCLPADYDGLLHAPADPTEVVWPASFHSHPNDPDAMGGAVARLVSDGARFRMIGDPTGAGSAFGLSEDPPGRGVSLEDWPKELARIGIGVAPLADTKFNRAKSWLKPLELCAAGVPWVASPRTEYGKLHAQGAGLLAGRPRTWYQKVKWLRESESLRNELSEAGRFVASQWRLADHAWRWAEVWQEALSIQQGRVPVA